MRVQVPLPTTLCTWLLFSTRSNTTCPGLPSRKVQGMRSQCSRGRAGVKRCSSKRLKSSNPSGFSSTPHNRLWGLSPALRSLASPTPRASSPPSELANAHTVSMIFLCLSLMRLKSSVRLSGVTSSLAMRSAAWAGERSIIRFPLPHHQRELLYRS